MKTKKLCSRIAALLLAACMLVQSAPVPEAQAAVTPDANGVITYAFNTSTAGGNTMAHAALEKCGWEINPMETDPHIAYNRNSAGWSNMNAVQMTPAVDAGRRYISIDLDVPSAGYYDIALNAATESESGSYELYMNGRLANTVTMTPAVENHSLGTQYLAQGVNTFKLKYLGSTANYPAWPELHHISLSPSQYPPMETLTLDFTSDPQVTSFLDMNVRNQGIRFYPQGSTCSANATGYTTFVDGRKFATIGFNKKANAYATFDFEAPAAGNYDIVIPVEDNPNHGIVAEVAVNNTVAGQIDTAHALARLNANKYASQILKNVPLDQGYNILKFTAKSGSDHASTGVWNLYFKEAVHLVDTTAAASGDSIWSVNAANTTASADGKNISFTNGQKLALNITAPKYGLYYIYLNAANAANGFGGDVLGQTVTRFADFGMSYTNEAADTVVTRAIGPLWLAQGANNAIITLTETISANSVLAISDIELHEVKKNLWMIDSASQNFSGVSLKTHGWELDPAYTNDGQYQRLMMGSYAGALTYPNSIRTADNADINLGGGPVAFKIRIPADGVYDITGTFKRNGYASNVVLTIPGTEFSKTLTLNLPGATEFERDVEIGSVMLTQGEHTIVVNRGASGNYFYPVELKLTANPAPSGVRLSLNSKQMVVGESSSIHADVAMNNGDILTLPIQQSGDPVTGYIKLSSSDTDVVTLENGTVTAVGAGTADIQAEAHVYGQKYTASVTVKVSDKGQSGSFVIVADDALPIATNARKDVLIQGALDNIVVDLNMATQLTVSGTDDAVATAEIVKRNGNVYARINSAAAGSADITVTAVYDGMSAQTTFPITVEQTPPSSAPTFIDFATPLAASFDDLDVDTHGWALNPELNNDALWNKIAAGHTGKSAGSEALFHFNYDNAAQQGENAYIDIKVDKDGWYALKFMGCHYGNYGAVASFHIDGEYVGEFDFENKNSATDKISNVEARFRDIYLTEGVHVLKIERVNPHLDTRHALVYMYNLQLVPIPQPTSVVGVKVNCDRGKTLLLGDSAQLSYSLRMSDGTDYFFPLLLTHEGSMTISALTPDRVSYTDGVIAARGYGTGMFEISADRPGEDTYTAGWSIDVASGQMLDFSIGRTAAAGSVKLAETNWAVDSANTSDAVENANPYQVSDALGLRAKFGAGDVLALDVNILESGAFDVDAVGSRMGDDGAVAALYFDDTYLGEFDFSNPDGADAQASEIRQQLNSIELTRGMHKLYIKRVNATGGDEIYLDRIVLAKAESLPELAGISILAESDEVVYKHTLQTTAVVYMSNGRVQHFGAKLDGSADPNNQLVYSSSDPGVFTADERTGSITGVAVGEAELQVDVTLRGAPYSQSQKFSTVRVLELSIAQELFVNRSETVSTQLFAVLDDEQADLSQAESVTVLPADSSKISGYAVIDTQEKNVTLHLTGLRIGVQTVTVEAVLDGVTGRVDIPVQVFAPGEGEDDLDINFVSGYSGSPDGATIAADGWQLNYALTTPGIPGGANWGLGAAGLNYHALAGEQLVIDFMVRESGSYSLDFYGGRVGNYGQVAAIYLDDMYLGEFDFAHPTDDPNERINSVGKAINSVSLTPGTHTITFKRINEGNYRHSFVYAMELDFTKLDAALCFDRAAAQAGKTQLIVGESTDITTQAIMSDGSVRHMGKLKDGSDDPNNWLSIENSNPSVAKLENGRIYALAAGETTVTVTAMVDGEVKTDSVVIGVSSDKLANVQAALSGEVYVGKTVDLDILATTSGGAEIDPQSLTLTVTSGDAAVAAVDGTKITGVSAGNATITVQATLNGETASTTLDITVADDGMVGITVSAMPRLIRPDSAGTQIKVEGGSFLGESIGLENAAITYTTSATDVIHLSAAGYVTPKALGRALVEVNVRTAGGMEFDGEITIIVTNGKVGSSYYTQKKVTAAKENIENYSWARGEARAIIAQADKYIGMDDFLWSSVTTQEVPRSTTVGYAYDPEAVLCRYCGVDLGREFGNPIYSYNADPINEPWKLQCKACRRKFPSNDFASFYELGIDEHGNWSYELAKAKHIEMFGGLNGYGYLVNKLYPEVATVPTLNGGRGLSVSETVEGWGVDDGYGYKTGYVYKNTNIGDVEEVHTYVAMYNRFIMGTDTLFDTVVQTLSQAYLFTDDVKYGRACAIVIDRLADVYPDMEIGPHWKFRHAGETGRGKLEGRIWESDTVAKWIAAYDAVWPLYDDPYVVSFLNEKAEKYRMSNDKSTPEHIRQNIEDGIIREAVQALKDGKMYGNFGLHQVPVTYAAVVLDTMPETKEILDFLMRYDEFHLYPSHDTHTGGEILHKIYNDVDRNGGTKEGTSPNYQNLWYNTMADIANILNGYDGYAAADLFQNVKLNQMLKNQMNYIMMRRTSLAVGDSGVMAGLSTILPSPAHLMNAFYATNDPVFAQMLYFQNGNKTQGLRRGIYDADPEDIRNDVQRVIDEYGEYPFDESVLMAGTGFASLRDGSYYGMGSAAEHDNQRGFWMSYGLAGIHGHKDTMNLGVYAYGLDFAPDFGYPDPATLNDQHRNWGMSTLSHNLVVVNDKPHSALNSPGKPLHFDDTQRVKLMDAQASEISSATDIYRRTVVMIEVNDDVSYGVDFFRVKGGNEHLYSFHAQSDTIGDWAGFKPQVQESGSYAGENIPYETAGSTSGYTYLTHVRKDTEPGTGEVMVEFDITDYRGAIPDSSDMHLRLTMLNDFELTNVSLAKGVPPNKEGNPDWIEFFLARRSGTNLDSTFTTVIEPYQGERYIADTQQVSVERADGQPVNTGGDVARAIKVTLADGREDYIIYATNNSVEYLIDGKLSFIGFVGVCSMMGEDVAYSYLNHGTKLGDIETVREYTGEVADFTRGMKLSNSITVRFDDAENVDLDNLAGRHIYVENDGAQSGAYKIEGVTDNPDGTVTLDIGGVTLVRSADNITAETADFTYNISPRQWFNIPLSAVEDRAPEVAQVSDSNATVASKWTQTVSAVSRTGGSVTFEAVALPRGASVDEQTGTVSWVPDKYQMGKHHFSVAAVDGDLRTTVHFEVEVLASSGDMSSNVTSTPSLPLTPGAGTVSGGSGAQTDTSGESGESTGNTGVSAPDTPAERFIDLGGHAWAKEAIYRLVDKGVVNGTSENTYSPAANIKRADFAIMLVRAFGITEGEGENFADVDPNKYYAEELRAARVSGIVNGIGENKFNPEGEITRQDMMLMLARALDAMEIELSEADREVLTQFADAADISEYAADAVSRVVKDGIIAGANGRINPLENATRAEVAVMLDRVLAAE